jgi:riboflavin kinase/FMN adenylyltransferase
MELIRGLHNIKEQQRGCVLTIGNFDGMHLGHVRLLSILREKGRELQKPTTVILFEPQPCEYFDQENPPARLMRLREKVEELEKQTIDYVVVLPFSENLARQEAEDFVATLISKLGPTFILVGDDFRFGYHRAGDIELLQKLSTQFQFVADCLPTLTIQGERVSSTRIRKLLAEGELAHVEQLLGHHFSIIGRIAQGDKRGRLLGFPTANIHLRRKTIPLHGVFVVAVDGVLKDQTLTGVANLGTRPTLSGHNKPLLEVHLFNFDQDIYGKRVKVKFLHKLRDEQKFADFQALQTQIQEDIRQATNFLLSV